MATSSPSVGQLVRVRSLQYLVDEVVPPPRMDRMLESGIRRDDVDRLRRRIEGESVGPEDRATVDEELEAVRERREKLVRQVDTLRDLLALSRETLGLTETTFRDALSASLELRSAPRLQPLDGTGDEPAERWIFPALDREYGADPSWADTLDTLRPLRRKDQKWWDWRREARPRPVVFSDPGTLDNEVVHLHLSHRVVQRLLGRFLSQGFVHDDISRTCLLQTRDAIPRVVLIGRLSLYGEGASRLHDQIIPVPARWIDPDLRKEPLKQYAEEAAPRTAQILEEGLASPSASPPAGVVERILASAPRDVAELMPWLQAAAHVSGRQAGELLTERGNLEAYEMEKTLDDQKKRIEKTLEKHADTQLVLGFDEDERRQLEADRRHWDRRLNMLADERAREPERIRASYVVKAQRLEPVGLVYLWPVSG